MIASPSCTSVVEDDQADRATMITNQAANPIFCYGYYERKIIYGVECRIKIHYIMREIDT